MTEARSECTPDQNIPQHYPSPRVGLKPAASSPSPWRPQCGSRPESSRTPGGSGVVFPRMTDLEKDEQFYRDTESVAFPKLDDRQLAMLEPLGARRIVRRGEVIFKAGQRDLGLIVTLTGELEVFELRDGHE